MLLRNPISTPTIFLKAYQRYTTAYCLPILYQILVYHRAEMSRLRDTEQEVQCTSNRKLTEQFIKLKCLKLLLVFSVTPFKIDQNQNRSIDKVQNLGNERRYTYKDPRQASG